MVVNMNRLDLGGTQANTAPTASTAQSTSLNTQAALQQPQTEVSITSTASLLARLQQALSVKSAVDQGRVDSISKALAAGTYRIDGDNIARGLINTERSLGELTLTEI